MSGADDVCTLLRELISEVKALRHDLRAQNTPDSGLLLAILAFVGSTSRFTAAELLDRADALLLAALANRDAWTLGSQLSALEGSVVLGRRLVRKGKTAEGVSWAFEAGVSDASSLRGFA